ncbi:MAG: hypothetical protein U9N83_16865 [Thermodesulfobacteriota bacterium]|nr:hypothetical protein [Thermodesulfobacteriota bacterium]
MIASFIDNILANFDVLVKSQEFAFVVIPSRIGVRDDGQAGIQQIQLLLDAGSSPA